MRIVFLTNTYTGTAVPYIQRLIEAREQIIGIFLLKTIKLGKKDIRGILRRIRKYGLRHMFMRVREILNVKSRYVIFFILKTMKVSKKTGYNCVEELLLDYSLNSYVVGDMNSPESVKVLEEIKPDMIFVCTFSQILSRDVLRVPRCGCINIHAGLLPKYRGPASNFWVLFNKEKKTGVTFHYMTEGIDNGDIILQKELMILSDDTEDTLDIRLAKLGSESIIDVVEQIEKGTVRRTPQSEQESSYFPQPTNKQRKSLVNMRGKKS